MSKRYSMYEYQGEGYTDYELLMKGITVELEKLYHTLWSKRKDSQRMRIMAKQIKTAWTLFKLGSRDAYLNDDDEIYTDKHIYEDRKSREIYVNSRNESRFHDVMGVSNPEEWDNNSIFKSTKNQWLRELRRVKALHLMVPYLGKTMVFWKDGDNLYYKGILNSMSSQMTEIHDFLKYGKTWTNTKESVMDLEKALKLLSEVQNHFGENDEKDAWKALFSLIENRYRYWYD